jgi:lysophospholipid acyltransferase (LPLAT)-like uncharacterized protein
MKRLRQLLKSEFVFKIIAYLASLYIRLVFATCKWTVKGKEIPQAYIQSKKPFIVCFWHGRLGMLACAWTWKERPFQMLLSAHRDGRLIGKTVGHFGITSIWGSTQRGGTQALREMIQGLKEGGTIGITPDGPRGPNQIVTPGVISLALLAKIEMIPITYSTSRRVRLNTWDHFHLPLPFGRGVFLWGNPITAPASRDEKDLEAKRLQLETEMTALQDKADEMMKLATLKTVR